VGGGRIVEDLGLSLLLPLCCGNEERVRDPNNLINGFPPLLRGFEHRKEPTLYCVVANVAVVDRSVAIALSRLVEVLVLVDDLGIEVEHMPAEPTLTLESRPDGMSIGKLLLLRPVLETGDDGAPILWDTKAHVVDSLVHGHMDMEATGVIHISWVEPLYPLLGCLTRDKRRRGKLTYICSNDTDTTIPLDTYTGL